jgi:hypothetical protein
VAATVVAVAGLAVMAIPSPSPWPSTMSEATSPETATRTPRRGGDATTDLTVEVASSAVAPEADWAPPALLAGFPDHSRARPRIVLQLPHLGLCNLRQVWRCSADGCRFKRHGMLALVTCPLDRVHVDLSQDTSSLVMGHLIFRHTSRSFIRVRGLVSGTVLG